MKLNIQSYCSHFNTISTIILFFTLVLKEYILCHYNDYTSNAIDFAYVRLFIFPHSYESSEIAAYRYSETSIIRNAG